MVCHESPPSLSSSDPLPYAEIVLDEKAKGNLQSAAAVKYVDIQDLESGKEPAALAVAADAKQQSSDKKNFWMLAYCFFGIMVSFTLNGLVLEKVTSHRVLGEMSLTFVFCLFYSIVALGLRAAMKEKPSTMPQSKLMIVGLLAFGSTIASMVALRYVTFITRILGKSCKSIPVMLVGLVLGKSYALKKYVSVVVLSVGVAVFLVGTAHEKQHKAVQTNEIHDHVQHHERTPNIWLGFSLLLLSLLFDGATGALEDKYMEKYHIGAFDLMYTVNIYKSVFAAIGMVVMGEIPSFVEQVVPSLPNLVLLSLTGAMGQAFIFFTISKFGALTTSIIGTCRKVLSIVLSVILFGHILSLEQFIGLTVSFIGIGLNWVKMDCFNKKSKTSGGARGEASLKQRDADAESLLESSDDTADSEEDDQLLSPGRDDLVGMKPRDEVLNNREVERGLELVNVWARQSNDASATTDKPTAACAV
ncbi:Drug/metabolite transporter, partial [Globisporangium splendens]